MHYLEYKTILSAQNRINLYRGCTHGCIYCDSRSTCYHIEHPFEDIEVKKNAITILENQLQKKKLCMIGTGAMCDPYIPSEKTLLLTRQSLELIERYGFGLSILTKSSLILRDLDLLKAIHQKAKCVVQMTLTTYNDDLWRLLEPCVSRTSERFHTLQRFYENSISAVVWLSPILPFINDTEENLHRILDYCIKADLKAILCFGFGLTLREGNREYFYDQLDKISLVWRRNIFVLSGILMFVTAWIIQSYFLSSKKLVKKIIFYANLTIFLSTSKSFPILINNFPFFNKSLDRSNYANKPAFRDCLLTFKQRSYELAEHFEVSARTTLQDIDILSTAGIPVYTTQGKCGGIFIMENFVLNKTTLSNEEQNQILFALQNLTPTQQVTSNELLAKLSSLFNKTDTSWIEVNFSRWGNNDADTQRFRILKNAILQKQAIVFDYFSSYGETSRTVYPLKLLFKSKSWYLQAYCLAKKDYRVFKLNRMKCITTSPTYFTDKQFSHPPNSFDTLSSANLISLELLFNSSVAYRVYDEFKAEQIIKNQDGSFTVFVDFPNVSWLYDFLLSFGTSVKVIKPLSVREELFAETQNILNSYITN